MNFRKTRILIAGLLLLALLTAGCGAAPAAKPAETAPAAQVPLQPAAETAAPEETAPALPLDEQKRILEENRALWAFEDPYDSPWFYTYTDLDHNGLLEVIAATTQGTGIFTYAHYYEVLPDGSGLRNCYHEGVEIEGPDDWPEIVMETLPCYHDPADGRWYTVCEGVTRSGAAWYYEAWYALLLEDGVAEWELLAEKTIDNSGPTEVVTCRDAQGQPITEADYAQAVERRFAGMEASTLTLDWTRVEIPWPEEPEAAAAAPTGPAIEITKNPTSEALAIGGKTWFIAHAVNADTLTWQLLDPDGQVFSLDAAMAANAGLRLEALEGDTLAVSNVPASLNGWAVQACFTGGGGSAVTTPAYIYVGDFVTAYGEILRAYQTAYETGSVTAEYAWNNGISEMIAYSSGVGYALKDLDKNGVPELIIAGMGTEDFSDKMVYGLYTLVDGKPVELATSYARMRYYVRSDSSVYWEGSSGASYSYCTVQRLQGDRLEDVEMVFTDFDAASGQTVYYSQQGHSDELPSDKSVRIAEADFFSRMEQLESTIYVPPLTRIY
ncbi:MAG: hypothetical protein IJ594_00110 [Oscillospiraceae bacterium]|nr:hypothetical protein [Oscillospiraceae bacterium]